MFASAMELTLSAADRADLVSMIRATTSPAGLARRARCILLLADGRSYATICTTLGVTDRFISRWKRRYAEGGVLALADAPRPGRQAHRIPPALVARVLHLTLNEKPPTPLTHWTSRHVAATVGISDGTVRTIWRREGLQPHLTRSYMASPDPDFEAKATEIIGLYLAPPKHAVVFCVDEKTAIQALDRAQPVLPLGPGRVERHSFEYVRHGTLSLFAAFEVGTGSVTGQPSARHTSADFLRFLDTLIAPYGARQEIHVVLDNLSAHKTPEVTAWRVAHRNVHFHFTPTYSSWLNQVELWFAKISREMIRRGAFTSVADLEKKLLKYIKLYNKTCRPFAWTYRDPTHRIPAIKI
jgi:transposase